MDRSIPAPERWGNDPLKSPLDKGDAGHTLAAKL